MEVVRCPEHGTCCFLKTGTRDGPNKGKSFYVCRADTCDFVKASDVPVSHCLLHADFMIELQGLFSNKLQGKKEYSLFYRCIKSKAEGKQWCGNVPWKDPDPKGLPAAIKSQHTSEPPYLPEQQRNPFRVLDKNQEPSLWKQFLQGGEEVKMTDRKQGEKGDPRSNLKKEQTPPSRCLIEKALSTNSGADKKQPTAGEKPAGEGREHQHEAKLMDATHRRKASKESHSGELTKPSASLQEKADRQEHHHVQKQSGPPRGKDTTPLPQPVHSQNLTSKPQKGAHLSREHPRNLETSHTKGQEGPGVQAIEQKPLPVHLQTQKETRVPKGAPVCAGLSLGSRREAVTSSSDSEEDDVIFVSSEPGSPLLFDLPDSEKKEDLQRTAQSVRKHMSLAPAISKKAEASDPAAQRVYLTAQLKQKKSTLASVNVQVLPDKGEKLYKQIQELEDALSALALCPEQADTPEESRAQIPPRNNSSKTATNAPHLVPPKPLQGQGLQPQSSAGLQADQGATRGAGQWHRGPANRDSIHSLWKVTSEAIEALHQSLKTRPAETAVVEDPPGLKVPLLLHQKQALAWLLWRESQKPQGGILADDMGLGKTLTMIALILTQKNQEKTKEKDEKVALTWLSKDDSTKCTSGGTLIVCPASLIHHWKNEVEKRVDHNKLRVCLYHGPNRDNRANVLATYDIVITTYSLLAKESPTKEQEGEVPGANRRVEGTLAPLFQIVWARVILDEAHNVKNPRVQASIAVCKLQACARWAVTGTPIQNNLLDMYSLLKFLRCSPFDEFHLWKTQVDNGSEKGGERLSILTKSLLLRRAKDQLDSTGKPLVALPQRKFQLHRLKLSEAEESVYNVLFARSRSALQSYLKGQGSGDRHSGSNPDNPFSRVAQEFGSARPWHPVAAESQRSSTTHILSQLLRLRQSCCHLSLLKSALDPTELKGEGLVLSLEEQLSALTLCEPHNSEPSSTVALNGKYFQVELFDDQRESTKISSLLSELETIRTNSASQKSVIVSQWTSMLKVIKLHLKRRGLTYATIDGSVNPKQRMDLVEAFNTSRVPQVMLISLLAGGVGLNLTGGNHLFLLDMHWNPSLEDQACDRIYRVGQEKDVVIHRFVCEGTVEDKILQLQEKKKDLAKQVLTGSGESVTKLSLADLRVLFGI